MMNIPKTLRSHNFLPIILLFSLLISPLMRLDAKCREGYIEVWPKSPTLVANPTILLNTGGNANYLISLARQGNLFLESEEERVKLVVIESYTGDFNISQVLLAPSETLRPGGTYRLAAADASEKTDFQGNYDLSSQKWQVKSHIDKSMPRWKEVPALLDVQSAQLGCGPVAYATYSVPAEANFIFVRLQRKGNDGIAMSRFILPVENGTVSIGHGMCAGPFKIASGHSYEVAFTAITAGGYRMPLRANIPEFTLPL